MQLLKGADGSSAEDCQRGRTCAGLSVRSLGWALGLLLLTAGRIVAAQAGNSDEGRAERPRLLFLLQRPAGAVARRDDSYAQLSATLRTAIEAANRYDIVLFGADQPSIKRALLEHTLPVSDLVEPISPDAFRRIARAIGARYTLTVKPTFDKQNVKTEMRYDEDLDGDNWRTGLAEQFGFEGVIGKRHLKTPELIALTVDAICTRLSVPSHLADTIKVGTAKNLGVIGPEAGSGTVSAAKAPDQPGTTRKAPGKKVEVARTGADASPGAANAPQAQGEPGRTLPGTPAAQQSDMGAAGKAAADGGKTDRQKPQKAVTSKAASKATDPAQAADGGELAAPPRNTAKRNSQRQPRVPANDFGPVNAPPPVAAPAPTRPDYLTLAMGARKDGDISTEITLLRKAITVAPRDAGLRRQLIQAYQDRHMADLALAEAERAIALLPADNTLKRLYGDALLAKGNNAAALKVYREVVARDPADVAAQVALADALLADNQYAEAMTAYQAAAAADPNSPLPHRRLARVYAGRAATDPAQYQESLKELTLSRQLASGGDNDIYLSDYIALMRQMEQRLRDMADELQNDYQAAVQGTRKLTEVSRGVSDLKERASALADYLDHVPFAAGHDGTHAHYVEGAAMLVQAIGSFRRVLSNGNGRVEDAQSLLRVARVDTLHELTTANKLLLGTAEPRRAMSATSAGGGRKPDTLP